MSETKQVWILGNKQVQRVIEFRDGEGLRTTSFGLLTARQRLLDTETRSVEFAVKVDGVLVTGESGGLALRDSRIQQDRDRTVTVIQLERDGLVFELEYTSTRTRRF